MGNGGADFLDDFRQYTQTMWCGGASNCTRRFAAEFSIWRHVTAVFGDIDIGASTFLDVQIAGASNPSASVHLL
jgi:hypothetical protein